MGKQTPKLVVAALIIAALVVLALQNASPYLPLVFLGLQTGALPMGVWLTGAIALGALTAIAIATLTLGRSSSGGSTRRRWTVRPDEPSDNAGRPRAESWHGKSPQEPRRNEPPARDTGRRNDPSSADSSPGATAFASAAVAAEDWQAWGKRPAPSKWEDWSQASGNDPADENLSKKQRRDREQAEATIHELDKGWDESAQDTVYVAPGGSEVEDALDEITDGWEDWDSPDNPLADTAYAQRYDDTERASRRDSIYAPPDDSGNVYKGWENLSDETEEEEPSEGEVYDADYRVIIPPYRPLEDDETEQ